MKLRPTSITVIGWLLVVLSTITLMECGLLLYNLRTGQWWVTDSPLPAPLFHVLLFTGLLARIVCGFGLLKGWNWARILIVAWWGIEILIGIAASPIDWRLIPNVGILLLLVFFLFRRKANDYFGNVEATDYRQDTPMATQEPTTGDMSVRNRWLVFLSLILAILVEGLVDSDITARAILEKDFASYLALKAICLAVVLSPLCPYFWLNGRRGIKGAWAVLLAIGVIIGLRLAIDAGQTVMLFSR